MFHTVVVSVFSIFWGCSCTEDVYIDDYMYSKTIPDYLYSNIAAIGTHIFYYDVSVLSYDFE
jgi:hypothetical protein